MCSRCLSGKSLVLVLLLVLFSFPSFSQQTFDYHAGRIKHRISFGPVISMFKNHPYHTTDNKAKFGFNVAYKAEVFLGHKANFMTGLEYMTQGLRFRGYYEAPGYTYLYDDTFPYTHELRFNELQWPIALKLAFNREKEKAVTAYVFGGIGGRYIINSYAVITNDSTETSPYDGKSDIGFEHEIAIRRYNAFYHGGFGVQKNYRESGKALFFEFTFKYGISRLYYSGHQNSNDLSIKNNTLAVTLGFRI